MPVAFAGSDAIAQVRAALVSLASRLGSSYGPGAAIVAAANGGSVVAPHNTLLDGYESWAVGLLTDETDNAAPTVGTTGTVSIFAGQEVRGDFLKARTDLLTAINTSAQLAACTGYINTTMAAWPVLTSEQFAAAYPVEAGYDGLAASISSSLNTLLSQMSGKVTTPKNGAVAALSQSSAALTKCLTYAQNVGIISMGGVQATAMKDFNTISGSSNQPLHNTVAAYDTAKAGGLTGKAMSDSIVASVDASGTITSDVVAATAALNSARASFSA